MSSLVREVPWHVIDLCLSFFKIAHWNVKVALVIDLSSSQAWRAVRLAKYGAYIDDKTVVKMIFVFQCSGRSLWKLQLYQFHWRMCDLSSQTFNSQPYVCFSQYFALQMYDIYFIYVLYHSRRSFWFMRSPGRKALPCDYLTITGYVEGCQYKLAMNRLRLSAFNKCSEDKVVSWTTLLSACWAQWEHMTAVL